MLTANPRNYHAGMLLLLLNDGNISGSAPLDYDEAEIVCLFPYFAAIIENCLADFLRSAISCA